MFHSETKKHTASIVLLARTTLVLSSLWGNAQRAFADDFEEFRAVHLASANLNFAYVRTKKTGAGIEFFEPVDQEKARPKSLLLRTVDKNSLELTIQANSKFLTRNLSTQEQAFDLFKLTSKAKGIDVLVIAPGTLEDKWVGLYYNADGQIKKLSSAKGLGDPAFDPNTDPSEGFVTQILGSLGYNAAVLRVPSGRIEVYTTLTNNLTGKQVIVFEGKRLNPSTIGDARACAILKLTQKLGAGAYLAELILGDKKTWPRITAAKAQIE